MRDYIMDIIGVICLFGAGYGLFVFGYGMGW